MSEQKFKPGQEIRYRSQAAAGIDMKRTEIVGFQDVHENRWKKTYVKSERRKRPKQVKSGEGRMENRYIISHYWGWYPSTQKGLNPDLDLKSNRRYMFAYESELSATNV